MAPISTRVAELWEESGSEATVNVDGPGTGDGFVLFCDGETDISDASRAIKEEEAAACEENGVEFIELKIAFDGLSVITTQTVVPQDIDVTGRAAFVPLEAPAETWAEAVLSAPARETDGRSAETVKALYDIQSVAQTLCKLYQG